MDAGQMVKGVTDPSHTVPWLSRNFIQQGRGRQGARFQALLMVLDFKVPLPSPRGQGALYLSKAQASLNGLLDLRSTLLHSRTVSLILLLASDFSG